MAKGTCKENDKTSKLSANTELKRNSKDVVFSVLSNLPKAHRLEDPHCAMHREPWQPRNRACPAGAPRQSRPL